MTTREYYLSHKAEVATYAAQYHRDHPEVGRASTAKYRATHPQQIAQYALDHPEVSRKSGAKYRENHREERKILFANWYASHKDAVVAYCESHKEERAAYRKQWFLDHPELRRYYRHLRRSRQNNAPGADYITPELLESRWEYYGRNCYLCGKPAKATDHVKPLSKGGSQWPCNLRPICKTCNSMKGYKWPYDFEAHRQRINEGR